MLKRIINTDQAPAAIGTYSQAVQVGETIYLSGQIALDPKTGLLVSEDFSAQLHQVFKNLSEVCLAAHSNLGHIVKLTVYLTDLKYFPLVNELMAAYFDTPYPARAAVGVSQLPKGALVEIEGIAVL